MFCGILALKLEHDPMELNQLWEELVKSGHESWKLKVENNLVSDVLKEDIAALDEYLEDLEDIRSYQ